jgi:tRNA pseudouridine55 synthase
MSESKTSNDGPLTGFYLVDKPLNTTSNDVCMKMRRLLKIKKIGHAGTLDPLATGLLIVGIGRKATRRINEFRDLPKEYTTTIRLGYTSETYDSEGPITKEEYDESIVVTREKVEEVLEKYTGKILQTPPAYSAKRIAGKRAYDLARQGKTVMLKPCQVTIHELELMRFEYPEIELRIRCSKGTYIRSLGKDIGESLEVGGYLTQLRRTKIGEFNVEDARDIFESNTVDSNKIIGPTVKI